MATSLQFCPHCGAPVTDQDQQCPKCQTDLRPFRTAEAPGKSAPAKQRLNLNLLASNPYREGMRRLKERETSDQPQSTPTHRWHWPWSKS